jgi:hypothetical protein
LRALCVASALALSVAAPAMSQAVYPSAQAAAQAFTGALALNDVDALRKVLGPNHRQLVPGGVDQENIYRYLAAWVRKHDIVADGGRSWVAVGDSGWTLPVPLVRAGDGWRFDPVTGKAEIRRRALDRNELTTIETLQALQAAQTRYAQEVGQGRYAMRLVSRPGERDGLYWPDVPGAPEQAFGPDALAMGPGVPVDDAYFGYRYKILPGSSGNSYRIVAWPARYGQTGIGTFVVGPEGGVLESDLGSSSATRAAALREADIRNGSWIDANGRPSPAR